MSETIKNILKEIKLIKRMIGGASSDEYIETNGGQLSLYLGEEVTTNKSRNVQDVSKRKTRWRKS